MAEVAEGRPATKENIMEPNTQPAQNGGRVSQGLQGVGERARKHKDERFTALLHQEMIQQRIADPRILRLIRKWLNAGIIEDGLWSETETGTPPA